MEAKWKRKSRKKENNFQDHKKDWHGIAVGKHRERKKKVGC